MPARVMADDADENGAADGGEAIRMAMRIRAQSCKEDLGIGGLCSMLEPDRGVAGLGATMIFALRHSNEGDEVGTICPAAVPYCEAIGDTLTICSRMFGEREEEEEQAGRDEDDHQKQSARGTHRGKDNGISEVSVEDYAGWGEG